ARAHADAETAKGVADGVAGREWPRVRNGCTVGAQPEIGRPVAQEEREDRHDRERRDTNGDRGATPAAILGQPAEEGEEDQLARRAGRRQRAEDQSAALDEPAAGDGGGE